MKTCLRRHGNKFLRVRLHWGAPRCVLELKLSGLSHLWHQGLSSALHVQISCILCRGGGGGGQLCCWGMHVKRHWRPVNSRLLIRCNIMDHLGHKEPGRKKIDARIEIYCLPRGVWNRSEPGDNARFPPANVFLIQTVHPEGMRDYQRKEVICWWLITGDGSEIHLILAPADQIFLFFHHTAATRDVKKLLLWLENWQKLCRSILIYEGEDSGDI